MINLDIACGENKNKGFVGIDIRPLPGVDIVHDLESFPWPVESESVRLAIASHIVEHIKPWFSVDFMNEVWRVLIPNGEFLIATPYPGSRGFWQDPTHCNGWNEATFQYFDPEYPLYQIYKPKPWKIKKGFPTWQMQGNLEIILNKVDEGGPDLGINVTEEVKSEEVLHG